MGQINTNNYPTVDSLADVDLLIVENAIHGTGTTTPKQLRENAIGTTPLRTTAQTVTGAINELKTAIDAGSDVKCYDIDTISSGYLGEFDGKAKLLLLHLTTDGTADAINGYTMLLSYSGSVARMAYGQLYDREMQMEYDRKIYNGSTLLCEIMDEGTGTEADPIHVDVLGTIDGYVTAGWNRNNPLGDRATAEGIGTEASGNYAHAHGYQTTASGNQSTAMGYSTTASADGATAMGNGSTASGANSIAGGYNTVASGAVSTAIGTNTQATQQAQLATGKYNKANNDALVMVGNGTGASARSNALEVLLNGDVVAGNEIIDGQGNTLSVLAEALTKTASGNPVVISDCAGGKARSLKTTIEAIQDLHGLPFPYVGGAYKNKLPMTVAGIKAANTTGTWSGNAYTLNGVTFTLVTDNDGNLTDIIATGTATANTLLRVDDTSNFASGTYALNGCPTGGDASSTYCVRAYKDGNTVATDAGSGANITDIGTGSGTFIAILIWNDYNCGNGVHFKPMISTEGGAFAPYSNICPISGRTETSVNDESGNKLNTTGTDTNNGYRNNKYLNASGTEMAATDNDWFITEYTSIENCKRVILKNGRATSPAICFYDESKTFISGVAYNYSFPKDIEVPTNAKYFRASVFKADANTMTASFVYTATIQLGTTVYDLDINWDTGVATVTHVLDTFDGSDDETIEWDSPTRYRILASNSIKGDVNVRVPVISNEGNYSASGETIGTIFGWSSNSKIYYYAPVQNDLAAFKLWLASNPLQVLYELATPTTLQLTPSQLQMLKGYNRVSIDNGSIEVGYIAKIS